jgi:D-amino-acid oxidase
MSAGRVVVVGAGVIGLTAGVRLAQAGFEVEVLAREMPLETTSAVAAAIWYPYLIQPLDRAFEWAGRSLAEFERLADEPAAGVAMRQGSELLREPAAQPWWSPLVPGLRPLDSVPPTFAGGWSFVTPVVEMPLYLGWLQARLEALGGSMTRVALWALPDDAGVVVNCAGLGARSLVGDRSLSPVSGQVLVMTQVGLESWVLDGAGLTYVVPRSHDVILGGTDIAGDWDTSPDPGAAAQILGRATALVPELAEAHIVAQRVGLRPARPEVRLDVEQTSVHNRVVHCYGHGGAGVTVSWGCADEVVTLVQQLVPQRRAVPVPARRAPDQKSRAVGSSIPRSSS